MTEIIEKKQGNSNKSTDILAKLLNGLHSPGVALEQKGGVPYYSVDEDDLSIIIRLLDGVEQRGRLVEGDFVPL